MVFLLFWEHTNHPSRLRDQAVFKVRIRALQKSLECIRIEMRVNTCR
jgi:hypothetical protein